MSLLTPCRKPIPQPGTWILHWPKSLEGLLAVLLSILCCSALADSPTPPSMGPTGLMGLPTTLSAARAGSSDSIAHAARRKSSPRPRGLAFALGDRPLAGWGAFDRCTERVALGPERAAPVSTGSAGDMRVALLTLRRPRGIEIGRLLDHHASALGVEHAILTREVDGGARLYRAGGVIDDDGREVEL